MNMYVIFPITLYKIKYFIKPIEINPESDFG
jgi:hypothetical protein